MHDMELADPFVLFGTDHVLTVLLIVLASVALGTNYLYLRHKPEQPSLLDFFGPWAWYVLGMIAAGVVLCFVLYAPFPMLAWLSKRTGSRRAGKGYSPGNS